MSLHFLTQELAIDLGTANTVIFLNSGKRRIWKTNYPVGQFSILR